MTAFVTDQLEAAVREQQGAFERAGRDNAASSRLTERWDRFVSDVDKHRIEVCEHLDTPRPAFAAFWAQALVCEDCIERIPTPRTWSGFKCDLCPPAEARDLFARLTVRFAFVQVALGVCIGCHLELEVRS